MGATLYDKVVDLHTVRDLGAGRHQLFAGLHLVHEATGPQGFAMLRARGLGVARPDLTVATAEHVMPEGAQGCLCSDPRTAALLTDLEREATASGIRYHSPSLRDSGSVHVLAPEKGYVQPGMTVVCGDPHVGAHGAFGAVALGIGPTQVREVLASQTVTVRRSAVRRVQIDGRLGGGVTAKDTILYVIAVLGVRSGAGLAYEFCGDVVAAMSMEERMTLCTMVSETGARCGYVVPDDTTYAYLRGRARSPTGPAWPRAVAWWRSLASDHDAVYADRVVIDGNRIPPMATWGISPGQSTAVDGATPTTRGAGSAERAALLEACDHMGFQPGQALSTVSVDVAFLGSCVNGRVSDFTAVADVLRRSGKRVSPHVRAIAVPGSHAVDEELTRLGVRDVLERAGVEVRRPGCTLCVGTARPDGTEMCASSSGGSSRGSQGSPWARTLVMSPITVAAASVTGALADPRKVFALHGPGPRPEEVR